MFPIFFTMAALLFVYRQIYIVLADKHELPDALSDRTFKLSVDI